MPEAACHYSETGEISGIALCIRETLREYKNICRDVEDAAGVRAGEFSVYGYVASCGCCVTASPADVVQDDDKDYCSKPICTPNDANWHVCDSSGSKAEIVVCKSGNANRNRNLKTRGKTRSLETNFEARFLKKKDKDEAKTECRDPFYRKEGHVFSCGSCPDHL